MLSLNDFLGSLAIYVVIFTVYVVGTILWKPRLWLHDFPADIQALAAPKTADEKRLTTMIAVPLLALFFGLPILFTWNLKAALGADFSFLIVWLYSFALFFGVNLWDLVIIDWIGLSFVDPQKPPIAGTEGAAGWRNYRFHFYGFLKGCVISVVSAVVVAGVVTLLA